MPILILSTTAANKPDRYRCLRAMSAHSPSRHIAAPRGRGRFPRAGRGLDGKKARDHDITRRPPAFWAIPVLEKTPSAAFFDRSAEHFVAGCSHCSGPLIEACTSGTIPFSPLSARAKNQIWLRSAEILQWPSREKIHVSFAYHCGRMAGAECSCVHRTDVAARSAGSEKSTIPMGSRR
jgi:hypothetical protein